MKVTLLHAFYSRFLNCTNGTKLRKASHIFRSSCPELFYEKLVLKNFAKFGKHLSQRLLSDQVAAWKPVTLLNRDPGTVVTL